MSTYRIEWQMGGEILLDTDGTDWTPSEVHMQIGQAIMGCQEKVADAVADEFDDCDVEGDGTEEWTIHGGEA